MATVITSSVGKNVRNLLSDVKKIQILLNNLHPSADLEENGQCDKNMIEAIINFQRTFLRRADGIVDPQGPTLRRLNLISGINKTWCQWRVPPVAQKTDRLCWEASARMAYTWRYGNRTYPPPRARDFFESHQNRGATEPELMQFYRQLGMRRFRRISGIGLLGALQRSPVIFTEMDQVSGHAMIARGWDLQRGVYIVNNPAARTVIDFSSSGSNDSVNITASKVLRSFRKVDPNLGLWLWSW